MNTRLSIAVLGAILLIAVNSVPADAQFREASVVESSTTVLNEFMAIPNEGLPRSMLAKAEGVVIIPATLKVGFVAGVRHGKGVAVIRDQNGAWQAPSLITMTGGSVGWQVGIQSTDVILVFNTRKSVNGLLSGKFTVGVDAAAAAGPVGRQASAATDGKLQAEILSYSRSRGLFVGASVDGSVLQIDAAGNQAYYRSAAAVNGAAAGQLPPSASQLLATLASYSGAPVSAPGLAGDGGAMAPGNGTSNGNVPGLPAPPAVGDTGATMPDAADVTRQELAAAAQQLGGLLDESWRRYLSLPKGVFSGTGVPSIESLEQSLKRFDRVAGDTRYNVLLERAEFQQVYGLLKTYTDQVRKSAQPTSMLPSAGNGRPAGAPSTYR